MRVKMDFSLILLPFVVVSGILACASATANGTPPSVRIAIRETTVPLQRGASVTSFDVTVLAKNDGPVPIYLSQCMWEAQRLIGKDWTVVYRPICPATDSFHAIASGDSAVFPISVSSYAPAVGPANPGVTSGQYRIGFGIGLGKSPLDNLQDRTVFVAVNSSQFFVTE